MKQKAPHSIKLNLKLIKKLLKQWAKEDKRG